MIEDVFNDPTWAPLLAETAETYAVEIARAVATLEPLAVALNAAEPRTRQSAAARRAYDDAHYPATHFVAPDSSEDVQFCLRLHVLRALKKSNRRSDNDQL